MIIYYSANQSKSGLKILLKNEPCLILENQFVKPGKGQPFNRIKIKKLISGKIFTKIFKSNEKLIYADVLDVKVKSLYKDKKYWNFIKKENFEQFKISKKNLGEKYKWIIEQLECIVTFWDENPINITLPRFVDIKVCNANFDIKGDTIKSGNKYIILTTGAIIKAPIFIRSEEIVRVDTNLGEYVSRIK
ncbi:efp [Wigglesworthia glossinidia endosymbiont of Glossina brevipalpis]|uniref:Elongation factor P n=1 Tax=Wigglesworthia glossinidia brevipalpis TaxID=36870 RepID=EFP_WIGBR|nr:RecName: Full=Elongation factor P; Short=EF-P [Wigglesworthia glossinidia endosymbiont of Glossina brevipalpis]BAC24433.1 efp [Wigglesworthia glossinidia endosymbiont of Glossina brevipalpis]